MTDAELGEPAPAEVSAARGRKLVRLAGGAILATYGWNVLALLFSMRGSGLTQPLTSVVSTLIGFLTFVGLVYAMVQGLVWARYLVAIIVALRVGLVQVQIFLGIDVLGAGVIPFAIPAAVDLAAVGVLIFSKSVEKFSDSSGGRSLS